LAEDGTAVRYANTIVTHHDERTQEAAYYCQVRTLTIAVFVVGSATAGLLMVRAQEPRRPDSSVAGRPIQVGSDAYVSSNACRACHPSEYASWHASFHRTMTAVATEDSVRASFDHVVVNDVPGNPIQLERRGSEFWATLNDPDAPAAERPSRVERQIVMTTGSHQQQAFWYRTGRSRVLGQLPAMYLIGDQRWIPRPAAFMRPPSDGVFSETGRWNGVCINCHATHGKWLFGDAIPSNLSEARSAETTTAEFGIACEACHGPASEHIRINRDPLRRYVRHVSADHDLSIVEPRHLLPARTSEVCGQCHGVWNYYRRDDEQEVNLLGFPFRPGDELRKTRYVIQPSVDHGSATAAQILARDPGLVRDSFWSDGMIRVSGREYNGLIDSPCFRNAEDAKKISCSSCHTMHKADDDPRPTEAWADTHQVALGLEGNDGCLQCHERLRTNVSAHTRHAPNSSGSSCYNCHMPYTTYGLLRALRSHQISSPTVAASVETGRPNACNLCHLDKTLAWTSQFLADWYQTPTPALGRDEETIAASLLWLLKGDAGQRALTAWSMGWKPAQEASGSQWSSPFLIGLLDDPYDAVRAVAYRSLRSLPGMERFTYDFMAPHDERLADVGRALTLWQNGRRQPDAKLTGTVLYQMDGALDAAVINRLASQRDDRRVSLRE
jgi:Cytochrome c552/Cytochrome c7 and related cytochrome c